jgi:hypothetical protein
VKRRNTSIESAAGPHAENAPLGEETAPDASSTDGESGLSEHNSSVADKANQQTPPGHPRESGLSEHNSSVAADSSNGTPLEHSNNVEPHLEAPDETGAMLEDRIRRLEDSLAELHKQKEKQAPQAAPPPTPPPPVAMIAPVAKIVPAPAPITTMPAEAASSFLFHVGKQMLSTAPLASVVQPAHPTQETTFAAGMRWTWVFFDAYAEVRAIVRMFVDPRYQMSWTSRLVPLVLAALLFTSAYWAPGTSIPGIGTLIDKLIDLPLAFLFFKILSHEARRYRQMSPDLPVGLRLPPER